MPTFTVSIPAELKRKLDEYPEIHWAEFLKSKFELRLIDLEKRPKV